MQTINEQLAKKIHDMAKKKGIELPNAVLFWFINKKGEIIKGDPRGFIRINQYTTDELLEMLPADINGDQLTLEKYEDGGFMASYSSYVGVIIGDYEFCHQQSQALGELYLYCINNDLIK